MRIGLVSDVHCNATALLAALDAMADVDEVLCAGDLVFDYRFSNDVLDIVRNRGIRHVLGNHDAHVLTPAAERVRSSPACDPGHVEHLARTPRVLETTIAGKRIYMVHGSPWDPLNEYLYPHSRNFRRLAEVDADFVVLGHTHWPMVERVGEVTVVNPGSVGDPRDRRYDRMPTYAVLDLASGECTIHTLDLAASA